jgi:type II secretory pathway component PulC
MYSPIFRNNLFERIGLGDGDVITQINSEVLNNPTKGFEVFSAFKEESELKIIYLKHGNEKKMIKVNIK